MKTLNTVLVLVTLGLFQKGFSAEEVKKDVQKVASKSAQEGCKNIDREKYNDVYLTCLKYESVIVETESKETASEKVRAKSAYEECSEIDQDRFYEVWRTCFRYALIGKEKNSKDEDGKKCFDENRRVPKFQELNFDANSTKLSSNKRK